MQQRSHVAQVGSVEPLFIDSVLLRSKTLDRSSLSIPNGDRVVCLILCGNEPGNEALKHFEKVANKFQFLGNPRDWI